MSHHGWGQHSTGPGTPKHRGWMSTFLRADAEHQVELLGRLAARLDLALDKLTAPEALPGEDWTRIARLRLDAYRTLATLEIEAAKLQVLRERMRLKEPMSDDEFQRQIEALSERAVEAMSVEQLEAKLAKKRAALVPANQ